MFAVAIDGPSGAGKSSIAKELARVLGFIYVDTGAIYRTVALYLVENKIQPDDSKSVSGALNYIHIEMKYENGNQVMKLNGRNVNDLIRSPEISRAASISSGLPEVRSFLLGIQRKLAEENNVIMDGRDIGTVVLPDAQLKIFLTASPEERAKRRAKQLEQKGIKIDFDSVLKEITERDERDSNRSAAPLKQAEDAALIDTSNMQFSEVVSKISSLINERRKTADV
jgi:cytidylate kinase